MPLESTSPNEQEAQINPDNVPLELRIAALEQALQFTMRHIQVQIRQESLIIGGSPTTSTMTLFDFYLQQLRQAQMVVNNGK